MESEIEKNLRDNLKALKNRHITAQQNAINTDSSFLADTERDMLELSLERLQLAVEREKEELDVIRKNKRLSNQRERINQARDNLQFLFLASKEPNSFSHKIKEEIERNFDILGSIDALGSDYEWRRPTKIDLDYIFHLNEDDLKKALNDTNVIEFMNEVKQNGWNVCIDGGEISIAKDGTPIAEVDMDFVVPSEPTPIEPS